MKIIESKYIGFCDGVKNSVQLVEKLNTQCVMLGDVVNNRRVVEQLIKQGAEVINNGEVETLDPAKKVVIRAHGITKETEEKLISLGRQFYDSTCPKVQKIHNIIKKSFKSGKEILIIGDKNHPEVIAENSICDYQAHIIGNLEECMNTIEKVNLKECILVIQTTFSVDLANKIIKLCKERIKRIQLYNTICGQTYNRQAEIRKLKEHDVDMIVVVGDKKSSNTRKLYELAKEKCTAALFIENANELEQGMFENRENIFITGGTSTPYSFAKEIEEKIMKG